MFDEELFRQLLNLKTQTPIIRMLNDSDIDKVHITELGEELLVYHEIKNIANNKMNVVDWTTAIKYLSEAVFIIYDKIKNNRLKRPEQLKEFIENCCTIYKEWDNIYREVFNSIKDYHHNRKIEKSIDEMDADELREFIKKHNIK